MATRSVTRGALNSGRMISRSVASAMTTEAARPRSIAGNSGMPASSWAAKRAKTATVPNSPWAKLKTPLDL